MQGRLSEPHQGKIQSFPWLSWQAEFHTATQLGVEIMEWTLDDCRLSENPLMNKSGRRHISNLSSAYNLSIPSLTGDCFMQAPFWKITGAKRHALLDKLTDVCLACADLGIKMIVVPLVDNGSIENSVQENILVEEFIKRHSFLSDRNLKILFESDYKPSQLAELMLKFPYPEFGINYDIGNSAALNYSPFEEFNYYGSRICNVHVKDRARNGGTVELCSGDADFSSVFLMLAKMGYSGNYILQTARAKDGKHAVAIKKYAALVANFISVSDNAIRSGIAESGEFA